MPEFAKDACSETFKELEICGAAHRHKIAFNRSIFPFRCQNVIRSNRGHSQPSSARQCLRLPSQALSHKLASSQDLVTRGTSSLSNRRGPRL